MVGGGGRGRGVRDGRENRNGKEPRAVRGGEDRRGQAKL